MVNMQSRILFRNKKVWNPGSYVNVYRTRRHYTQWNKAGTNRQRDSFGKATEFVTKSLEARKYGWEDSDMVDNSYHSVVLGGSSDAKYQKCMHSLQQIIIYFKITTQVWSFATIDW